ncbi:MULTISPECIES: sensor histidine kinase [Clostridium]|uniref:histidine kinase n=2 Tax=Clostridium TaxID=1485 RepID=A0A1S9N626_CLOBE|nr:ATP-binding protein [Clostridium beijerinckii]MZK51755.1 HAMP domain-containing protein [Clostridium beijerinckii]MZK60101.1 HAMP domain-containing protein [Clostridium beijerinckii]MZK70386.1 HAMP domain-containing protein [Clostridium beijerinckii]MZK75619.1 HAMP domain-containing protein [Clostridium beijerinckii]MZK85297.1 HAMP domain-containing protein [Clostridium beijerinckii]
MKNKDLGRHRIFSNDISNLKLIQYIEKIIRSIKKRIEKNIRFELMMVIGICFLAAFIFYSFSNNLFKREHTEPQIKYDYDSIERSANDLAKQIESQENLKLEDKDKINSILENVSDGEESYITDLDGKVLYKTKNVAEENIDIYSALKSAMTNVNSEGISEPREKSYIMPLKIGSDRVYLIYSKIPEARITYNTISTSNSSLALILTVIVFIVLFVVITNNKMKYLDEIAVGLKIIASGNLNYRIEEKGTDEIKNIAYNINQMAKEIGEKISAERDAEKTKADLITNVSHDLRTPLTSVMGYIGLVIQNRYKDEKEMEEYLNIAFNKAERLKLLIDDLFEYTKLNNSGITLTKTKVNLAEFLSQLIEELTPLLDQNKLTIYKKFESEKISVSIDTLKMLRVFENIITNAIKYSYKPGEILIGLYEKDGKAIVVFRNKGDHLSKEKSEKLFDRFYRLDESRNTNTGGSGLGLAISKNIVELHDGKIWAESVGNNISFYVQLNL